MHNDFHKPLKLLLSLTQVLRSFVSRACMKKYIQVRKETAPQIHDAGKSAGPLPSNNIDNCMPLTVPFSNRFTAFLALLDYVSRAKFVRRLSSFRRLCRNYI